MTLIEDLGTRRVADRQTVRFGLYLCPECSMSFEMRFQDVKRSKTGLCKSCSGIKARTKHGMSKTREYEIWHGEKRRCKNKSHKDYSNYGGRGIKFSDCFLDFSVWFEYVSSLENSWLDGYSLDRIDNNGNYEKENLKWSSHSEQIHNTRINTRNTTGYRGVSFNKRTGRYKASISINKHRTHLGYFDTVEEARDAYNNFKKDLENE